MYCILFSKINGSLLLSFGSESDLVLTPGFEIPEDNNIEIPQDKYL